VSREASIISMTNFHDIHSETYGPFTRNYHRPALPVEQTGLRDEDARIMARQGHAFVTSDEARVVHRLQDGESLNNPLRDVPNDGKTLGEIVVRGNIVMKEVGTVDSRRSPLHELISLQYFNDPDATKKAFRGGHFNTGDLAVRNADGSISILDRGKDLIISGGEVCYNPPTYLSLHLR